MDRYADEPGYQTAIGRLLDYDTLEPIIRRRLRKRSAATLVERGQALRIPLAPVPTMEELFSVDQYVHRGAFAELSCAGSAFKVPVAPFRLFRTPASPPGVVARLGESNAEYGV